MKRKICVITGSRAEYGLLFWIIKGIHEDPELELQLVVTGMHLSPEFGLTVGEIEKDGFPIAERVEMLLSSDTESAIAASMGLGMIGFAKAYERLMPDVLVVLGDRFEIFSAIAAAVPFKIPVAHIHGGEITEGAIDELFRHSITKMSHLHFTATELSAQRVRQMGEPSENVFCFGSPAIDNVFSLDLMSREQLCRELGIPFGRKIGVVTYHPVTLANETPEVQMSELLKAIESISGIYWIFTMPNADSGGRIIIKMLNDFITRNSEKGKAFISLGQVKYLSLLKYACLMVGNSSSGLIEAPSFALPVVNIGNRQDGRIKGKNVIDVPDCKHYMIVDAVNKALTEDFMKAIKNSKNPYGTGNASFKIVETLKAIDLNSIIKKRFQDM